MLTPQELKWFNESSRTQCIRLYFRIFKRIGYGWDFPTLSALHYHYAIIVKEIASRMGENQ